jgi:hypothetical protein
MSIKDEPSDEKNTENITADDALAIIRSNQMALAVQALVEAAIPPKGGSNDYGLTPDQLSSYGMATQIATLFEVIGAPNEAKDAVARLILDLHDLYFQGGSPLRFKVVRHRGGIRSTSTDGFVNERLCLCVAVLRDAHVPLRQSFSIVAREFISAGFPKKREDVNDPDRDSRFPADSRTPVITNRRVQSAHENAHLLSNDWHERRSAQIREEWKQGIQQLPKEERTEEKAREFVRICARQCADKFLPRASNLPKPR